VSGCSLKTVRRRESLAFCRQAKVVCLAVKVSKPYASINQSAQRTRGGGSMSLARGGGDVSPGNWSRRSVKSVFSRDNPTLMISIALFGFMKKHCILCPHHSTYGRCSPHPQAWPPAYHPLYIPFLLPHTYLFRTGDKASTQLKDDQRR
jgi:hypothetical protein